jgi:hypothetical protein
VIRRLEVDDMTDTHEPAREQKRVTKSSVQKFNREMIKRSLESQGLSYLRDAAGDFRVDFAYDDDLACAVSFWLMAVGQQDEIFGLEARSTKRFARDNWDWALFLVNEWNKRMRYPKAYFLATDPETDRTGEIRLEQYMDLEKGIHQELFDNLVYTMMGGATRFWSWMKEENLQRHIALATDSKLDG